MLAFAFAALLLGAAFALKVYEQGWPTFDAVFGVTAAQAQQLTTSDGAISTLTANTLVPARFHATASYQAGNGEVVIIKNMKGPYGGPGCHAVYVAFGTSSPRPVSAVSLGVVPCP